MSKLYFRYGTMNSSKTLQLLSVAHNYESQGKRVAVIKPSVDTRSEYVESRTGLRRQADIIASEESDIAYLVSQLGRDVYCVLVDEAQFITEAQVQQLTTLVDIFDIPVIAYGLKTDFKGELFPASKRLFELADSIEEIRTVCNSEGCNNRADFNMRMVGGKAVTDGEQVVVGDLEGEVRYKPVCRACYRKSTNILRTV